MHHTFISIALLAACAAAKPVAHHRPHPLFQHPPPGSPTCVSTATATPGEICNDIASAYNIQLSAFEADSAANSETCRDLLAGYRICVDSERSLTASVQSLPTTLNGTLSTITPAPSTTSSQAIETLSTITASSMRTLTYTLGTGATMSIRTVVVTHTTTDVFTYTTFVDGSITTSSLQTASSAPSLTGALNFTSSAYGNSSSSSTISISGSSSLATISSTTSSSSSSSSTVSATPSSVSSITQSSSSLSSSLSSSSSSSSPSSATLSSTASSTQSSSSLSSSFSSTSTCITAAPPARTQAGIVTGCTRWYIAVAGDYCYTVAQKYGLDVQAFMDMNPAVDPPNCPNMLAGDAYCVATCGNPAPLTPITTLTTASLTTISSVLTSTRPTTTITSTFTSTSLLSTTVTSTFDTATPTATASGNDVYRTYTGDGSVAAGWPTQEDWVDFESMFTANEADMKASCAQWAVPDDTEQEVEDMRTAILAIADATGVDSRFILATIMQESTGCVRVITTQYSVFNPGLMQSHNGTGTCNTNNAALGIPGVASDGIVQTPCPYSEIYQQIEDGTNGTSSGDGLAQLLVAQGHTDVSRFYRAARMYNGGSIDPSGDLGKGCCTLCYVSDIANRLTGWVNAPRSCTL